MITTSLVKNREIPSISLTSNSNIRTHICPMMLFCMPVPYFLLFVITQSKTKLIYTVREETQLPIFMEVLLCLNTQKKKKT